MRLIILSITQSLLLCIGQVFLKIALTKMGAFAWAWSFFASQLKNFWWLGCGLTYGAATVLWFYIIKHFPFSMAYPMISMSYVFGMIAAMVVFHENIPLVRWIGVFLIMTGCVLVAK